MGEMRNAYKVLVGNLKGRNQWEDLYVDGKMILECILWKQCGKRWTGFISLRIGASGRLLCIR